MKTQEVVIIGSGFGGLSAALQFVEFAKRESTNLFHVTVIDKSDFQLYTPDLYEIAAASSMITSKEQLRDIVNIDIQTALGHHNIDFRNAEVTGVDRAKKLVQTNAGTVKYDYLVLALGSVAFDYGIPGIAEHALLFKTIDHAIEIRDTVLQRVDSNQSTELVVCGAGPAGVEMIAEIATTLKHAVDSKLLRLVLIDGAPRVLGAFHPRVSKKAEKRLRALGVELRLDSMVKEVDAENITLASGRVLRADIVVWTGGIQANPLTKKLGLPLSRSGQIIVEPNVSVANDASIFAIGDCAQVPVRLQTTRAADDVVAERDVVEAKVEYVPQTAHEAVEQGKLVAKNILASVQQQPLQNYTAKFPVYVVTLGGKHALFVLSRGIVIGGVIGWFARKFISLRHFSQVLPFMYATSLWYRSIRVSTKND